MERGEETGIDVNRAREREIMGGRERERVIEKEK